MAQVGKMNQLSVVRVIGAGLLLDGEELGEILMPRRYVTPEHSPGELIDVFVLHDAEDRLTAIPREPYASVGEFAYLKVVSATDIGAFLDWGLPKDLLVPLGEQKARMRQGQWYVVYVYINRASGRCIASSKLDKFVDQAEAVYAEGESVELLICAKTDLGYKVIINNAYWGVLYTNEVFQPLREGQRIAGFTKEAREDGRIDVSLHKPGVQKVTDFAEVVLRYLREHDGFVGITDKSPPQAIYDLFGVSKQTYKKAIGALYKRRLITIEQGGIKLVSSSR